MRKIGNRWALGFLGLGICTMLGNLALSVGFAVSGERMTRILRNMAFKAMVTTLWGTCILIVMHWSAISLGAVFKLRPTHICTVVHCGARMNI